MDIKIEELNEEQKRAVSHGDGPLLIVAGAGTGKTRVITNRFVYLVKQGMAKPDEIWAVTFSEKAAGEMEERIDRLLPYGYFDLWVTTFHSFCKRVLEEYGLDIGLSTDFKLLDNTSAWLLIRQNLNRFELDYYKPLGNPSRFIHALIEHFSRCKDQAIYPEEYLKYSQKLEGGEGKRVKEVAQAFATYQQLLTENNVLDFGDLLNYCLRLFQQRPLILDHFRQKFKYILVDEFQDTNCVQYELLKLLAAPKNNLTVCADDDQAIYRFRGASFGNIVRFRQDFPRAEEIVLIKNYRSCQNILDLAHGFIQQNNPNRLEYLDKIDKRLAAVKKDKGIIEYLHFSSLDQEVRGVVEKIGQILKQDKEVTLNDFAILVRLNDSANSFCRALERAGLPYQFMALRGLYLKPVIIDIISYFKLLDNYRESTAMYRILTLPVFDIDHGDIVKISHYANKKSQSLYQAITQASLIVDLSNKTKQKLNFILSLIKKHSLLVGQKNVSEIFVSFVQDSGYLEYLIKKENIEGLGHLNQFYDKLKLFEENNLDTGLRSFMEQFQLELDSGEQGRLRFDIEQGPEMIRVMTVHGAKGLEFKYLFLVNLVDRKFPVFERKAAIEIPKPLIKDIVPEGEIHLEEERRLFYVAMTRAKKGLFFTSASDYGGLRKKKLSRFLKELGYEEKTKELTDKEVFLKEKKKKRTEKLNLPQYFSFTQFKAFNTCPLQYKFAHILKIPVRGKATFSYGKTMHNTLYEFVKRSEKEKLNLKQLLAIYEQCWIDDWYEDQNQKQKYFELGKKSLERFYRTFKQRKTKILSIQGKPALETPFNLKINGFSVFGKIDRIDKLDQGIEIIDYKTGKSKEKLTKDDKKQLLIYQIAAQQVFNLQPIKLTFYYLDDGKEACFLGSEQEIEKEKQAMVETIQKIRTSDFSATPGWHCKFCDFKYVCPFAQF